MFIITDIASMIKYLFIIILKSIDFFFKTEYINLNEKLIAYITSSVNVSKLIISNGNV